MMSYILQGSGALLGPCLGNLLGREVARHAPCICLRCAQLLSTAAPQPPTTQRRPVAARTAAAAAAESVPTTSSSLSDRPYFHQTLTAGRPFVQYYQAGIDGMSPLGSAKLRRRFPSATFQQKYFTNFVAPLPVLGHSGPVNVNLTFFCDPGVSHTGKACCKIC